jgi:hypothetical protein
MFLGNHAAGFNRLGLNAPFTATEARQLGKWFHGNFVRELPHKHPPDGGGGGATSPARTTIVVAHPDPGRQLGNIANEPKIPIFLRGSGFASYRTTQGSIATRTTVHHGPQHPGDDRCSIFIDGLESFLGRFIDHLPLTVQHSTNTMDRHVTAPIG